MESLSIILFTALFSTILTSSFAADTIGLNQTISDGQTIVSSNGLFELGFFSPGKSTNRYLGIWYKNISTGTVVWVANRNTPLTNNSIRASSGLLKFNSKGNLVLVSGSSSVIWSSNYSTSSSGSVFNPVAQLLGTGNLVIKDAKTSSRFIWESFDCPGNTLLPGMKFGKDFVTGKEWYLTGWRSDDDPSPSNLTVRMDLKGYPQIFLRNGLVPVSRMFHNISNPASLASSNYKEELVVNGKERYYKFDLVSNSSNFVASRFVLLQNGNFELLSWGYVHPNQGWDTLWTTLADTCDNYGYCDAYESCSLGLGDFGSCNCLEGFEQASNGCRRRTKLECGNNSSVRFELFWVVKLPDTQHSWFTDTLTTLECQEACRNNCSCTAHGKPYNSETGCLLLFGDLIDIKQDKRARSYALSVKIADDLSDTTATPSPQPMPIATMTTTSNNRDHKKEKVLAATLSPVVGVVLIGLVFAWRKKKRSQLKREGRRQQVFNKDHKNENQSENIELPLFSLPEIKKATNNFSTNNKLGEGGFGPVFKGLLEGQEIAVKRLSKTSRQGLDEFKNEVICIAKLQHRNLVKLLGYCIEGGELMLIYEYLPNKSLDSFIFDETKNLLVDWPRRFQIIHGIARGLLYLHQDSRLRVIHRDLKASNILLDWDMNPKISDFGLARMFKGYETEANTNHVVGTLGYISPEYAVNGLFSAKSDIFSFGVLVLEIVSGKKNREFSHQDHHDNLQGCAWRLYKEGNSLKLVDASLGNSWVASEVLRSIHVGLLCVRQRPEDRPSMSDVVLMLGSEGALPPPKQPGFFTQGSVPEVNSTEIAPPTPISVNKLTITQLDAR